MAQWQAIAEVLALAISSIDRVVGEVRRRRNEVTTMRHAADALQAITAIVDSVKAGNVDDIDPAKVRTELELLMTVLGQNDDAADAAVDTKFDKADLDTPQE